MLVEIILNFRKYNFKHKKYRNVGYIQNGNKVYIINICGRWNSTDLEELTAVRNHRVQSCAQLHQGFHDLFQVLQLFAGEQ